jgi:FkbM family methyltransferase
LYWRRQELAAAKALGSWRSARQVVSLAEERGGASGPPVRVVVPALDGHALSLRPGSSDAEVVVDVFVKRNHLPPRGMTPTRIWDLGCNIGVTMAHYATLFPTAEIHGVELVPETAELARATVEPWSERCSVLTGAVWPHEGDVSFGIERSREFGARIASGTRTAHAYSLNSLFGDHVIDFVKMDIEGAELECLTTDTQWTSNVRAITVEVHPPWTMAAALDQLRQLGYDTRQDGQHAVGVRVGSDVVS